MVNPAADPAADPAVDPAEQSAAHDRVRIVILEHDPANPPGLLTEWLAEAGADLEVRRLHAHDDVPSDTAGFDALISLGGALGVYDDDAAPWLADTRALLGNAVTGNVPTLAIGLGAQLLAVAAGGRVTSGASEYRLGAGLVAKRDETDLDPLFGGVPITPDVMHFRRDSVTALPRGSQPMLASPEDTLEAFRVGSAAWGMQFHIETTAEVLREWRSDPRRGLTEDDAARSERAFGPRLDESAEYMGAVWGAMSSRFVELVRTGIEQTPWGTIAPRLAIVTDNGA